jgi:uncharacterized membrane protein
VTRPDVLDAMRREDEAFERLEGVLGAMLALGVVISTILLGVGLGLWMAVGPTRAATVLLRAGLIALMATPMVRVLVSLAEYLRHRDWLFATMTAGVVLVLVVSVLIALSH